MIEELIRNKRLRQFVKALQDDGHGTSEPSEDRPLLVLTDLDGMREDCL